MRIFGVLPLLMAMAVLGSRVSGADPGAATLTWAKTSIKVVDESHPDWAREYKCEFQIDNPGKDTIRVSIRWDQPSFNHVGVYADATIQDVGSDLVNTEVSSITIRGLNTTTGNIDFEVTVPMPGSWP
ncbi:hypothetical protein [Mycobacterium kansasii]|uniref:hypothetical protein n=1 Tax=Mycobacterium kansasii TaxID=1768 RepID=UPI0004B71BA5|nr:hypothetical protein [Mycobacterium kansasii]